MYFHIIRQKLITLYAFTYNYCHSPHNALDLSFYLLVIGYWFFDYWLTIGYSLCALGLSREHV